MQTDCWIRVYTKLPRSWLCLFFARHSIFQTRLILNDFNISKKMQPQVVWFEMAAWKTESIYQRHIEILNGAVPSQNCRHFSHGSQAIGRFDPFFLAGEGGRITVPHRSTSFHHSPDCSGAWMCMVHPWCIHGASMCLEARATLVSDVKLDDALCLRPDAFNSRSRAADVCRNIAEHSEE